MTTVGIDNLNSSGEGLCSLNGLKVFVGGALPGEEVRIEVTTRKKTYAKGKLLEVLSPSKDRNDPICPVFGECGGCQIMHLKYQAQLEQKRERVSQALSRIGGWKDHSVLPCLPSPDPLSYRNKIQLPVVWNQRNKRIGLYRKRSHEIIPIEKCYIHCPQGEALFSSIREELSSPSVRYVLIRSGIFRNESLVIFVTDGSESSQLKLFAQKLMDSFSFLVGAVENIHKRPGNVILGPKNSLLAGRSYLFEKLLGKTFKVSPNAFFQVNSAQAEVLYAKALELAQIEKNETLLDAYCGVGTLSILAAEKAKKVIGVESVAPAILDARENASINKTQNVEFFCSEIEKKIRHLPDFEIVLLNPPRKGCDPSLLESLKAKQPRKIIYISCDPATLARDLRILSSHYTLKTVQPVDMFPQTMHVETIAQLSLR
ncbi:MAG: 23S rRNA (uracil-C(5))-methyltransferase RlmCD [Chlamydiae bacterium]|nr:23S rRNA (uracil-C(5))-methyltransferase RlmCD [Chlamydiota bacterium]